MTNKINIISLLFSILSFTVLAQSERQIEHKANQVNSLIFQQNKHYQLDAREQTELLNALHNVTRIIMRRGPGPGPGPGPIGRCNGLGPQDYFLIHHQTWKYGKINNISPNCVANINFYGENSGNYTFSVQDAYPLSVSANDRFAHTVATYCNQFYVGDHFRVHHSRWKTGVIKKIATNCVAEIEFYGQDYGKYIIDLSNAQKIYR